MKIKIIYIGLHIENLLLLFEDESFWLFAVAYADEFIKYHTFNPANVIFKLVYYLRFKEKYRILELFLLYFWLSTKFLSNSTYYRYSKYLEIISVNKIRLLDVDNENIVLKFIRKNKIKLIIVNTWGMLSKNIIFEPELRTINVHPSKLPKYRGALPTLWPLKNHDKQSAVTYMLLDEGMDTGEILKQHNFTISEKDTSISLEAKINKIIKSTFIGDVKEYSRGGLLPKKQDQVKENNKTAKYYEYRIIDWGRESCEEICNKINLYPYVEPFLYCYTKFNGENLFIKKAMFKKKSDFYVNDSVGDFVVRGLKLIINANGGIIVINLFFDIPFKQSILLIFKRRGKIQ